MVMVLSKERKNTIFLPGVEIHFSIRKKILELESLIAPELEDPRSVLVDQMEFPLRYQDYWKDTEAKWLLILQKTDNPHVKRLLDLMETAKVDPLIFRQTLGQFSLFPAKDIHEYSRPLTAFTTKVVEVVCRSDLRVSKSEELDSAVKCITHVLMKF